MAKEIRLPNGRGGFDTFQECAETFCPSCGHKGLWEDSMDDYYQGPGYWCLECNSISHLSSMDIKEPMWVKMLNDLKQATKG